MKTMTRLILGASLVGCASPVDSNSSGADDGALSGQMKTSLTISIDTSKRGAAIPEKYVGLAVERVSIHGPDPAVGDTFSAYYDHRNPNYQELVSLVRDIGVKHLRVLSKEALPDEPDPTPAEDDGFFQFARDALLPDHSVIYSLHCYNAEPHGERAPSQGAEPPPNTDNVKAAQHIGSTAADREMLESFALDNEPDWFLHGGPGGIDPNVEGYEPKGNAPGYKEEWLARRKDVEDGLGGAAPFSGPDTGSEWPMPKNVVKGSYDTSVNGVPFTIRFAKDAHPVIATQHFYAADNTIAPKWRAGKYEEGDAVIDPDDGLSYRAKAALDSKAPPSKDSSAWTIFPELWVNGKSYAKADFVQVKRAGGKESETFSCNEAPCKADPSNEANPTKFDKNNVWLKKRAPLLSRYQLAAGMLAMTTLHAQYNDLYDKALPGTHDWPKGLPYRMTEANAFSPGIDPENQIFALALWSLDFFHWWAAHGNQGVDPFTRYPQFNSPLYAVPSGASVWTQRGYEKGDFVAGPYAYGMRAFAEGSQGAAIDQTGVKFSTDLEWLAAHPVIGSGHLYVTLVNSTFDETGSKDANVTLDASGFHGKHARLLRLESAPGASGDATADGATLGGKEITFKEAWNPTWESAPVDAAGKVGPIDVRATSAVVVDITDD